MNKRKLFKYKISKNLDSDIFGIFYRKQKRRDFVLQKLIYFSFLELLCKHLKQLAYFKWYKFNTQRLTLRFFFYFFNWNNIILTYNKYIQFYRCLLKIVFICKKLQHFVRVKLHYYRDSIYWKYDPMETKILNLKKTLFHKIYILSLIKNKNNINEKFNNKVIKLKLNNNLKYNRHEKTLNFLNKYRFVQNALDQQEWDLLTLCQRKAVNLKKKKDFKFASSISTTMSELTVFELLSPQDLALVYKFGNKIFNSSISRVEYLMSLFFIKDMKSAFRKIRSVVNNKRIINNIYLKKNLIKDDKSKLNSLTNLKIKLKKKEIKNTYKQLYRMEKQVFNKPFSLAIMEVTKVKLKKKKFISNYKYFLLKSWKLRYFYGGLSKVQLKAVCSKLFKKRGDVFIQFIIALESRVDTLLYRSGLVLTIFEGRQLINHGFIYVNNLKVTKRSYVLKCNDILSINNNCLSRLISNTLDRLHAKSLILNTPSYIEVNYKLCMLIFLFDIIRTQDVPFYFNFKSEDLTYILYYYY